MTSNTGMTILIVEDNRSHSEIFSRIVCKSSLKVSSFIKCNSYKKSLEILAKITPDIIFLDYKLPDSVDLELLSDVKKQESTRFIPIVVITAQGNEVIAVDALQKGAMDYIVKNVFVRSNIENIIKNAMAKMDLQRQFESPRLIS